MVPHPLRYQALADQRPAASLGTAPGYIRSDVSTALSALVGGHRHCFCTRQKQVPDWITGWGSPRGLPDRKLDAKREFMFVILLGPPR